MTKTYFLTPGWDIPSSSPLLGSIIANPSQPDTALFTVASPSTLTLTPTSSPPTSFTSPSSPPGTTPTTTTGLFQTFLSHSGLGPEPAFSYDHKHTLSYSFRGQRSVEITPSPELLRAAAADARVATLFANNVGVYLVTGIKTVSGAGVTVGSAKGRAWEVKLEVGRKDGGEEEEGKDVVFAVRVVELRLPREEGGEVELQGRLDGEFGEGTFKVARGVDESVEGGEGVLVVTASATYVDLLTASTVKVGGEHGIWH
ncbi:hypothetical protein B0T16DRAFT_414557 [Cercophora newfieldiana]|uniref:Uncharacterized protein n=1 Tax=Cercophora newfieldiana TaxID=92897 RepID=A0AA40CRZ9_9PEZI|nr:hypothetical protein B0T16DRAFT_414557 [Cercophora newfieldiana]